MKNPPEGFTGDEWEGWSEFVKVGESLAKGIGCTRDVAMILLGLNDISRTLDELKVALERREPPEDPWKK